MTLAVDICQTPDYLRPGPFGRGPGRYAKPLAARPFLIQWPRSLTVNVPIVINGRFPAVRATHVGVKVDSVRTDHSHVIIRFGHELHADYWQEVVIPADLLATWYAEIADNLFRFVGLPATCYEEFSESFEDAIGVVEDVRSAAAVQAVAELVIEELAKDGVL